MRLSSLGALCKLNPHLSYILQNHVTMAIKSFHSTKELLVVADIDQDLSVVFDGAFENG